MATTRTAIRVADKESSLLEESVERTSFQDFALAERIATFSLWLLDRNRPDPTNGT